jgi:DNA-binding transcriptional MerR regulator
MATICARESLIGRELDLDPKGKVYRGIHDDAARRYTASGGCVAEAKRSGRMRIGEVAARAGVSTKTVRHYESVGLIGSSRLANGYRDYNENSIRLVSEAHLLGTLGIRLDETRPFLDCLVAGNERADDCADSLVAYRRTIDDLDDRIDELSARRDALTALLAEAADRGGLPRCEFSAESASHSTSQTHTTSRAGSASATGPTSQTHSTSQGDLR